jgi:ATP-dependent helicase HrpB
VPPLAPLPIDPLLPDAIKPLAAGGALVVRAPTGSGKTTRLPPALLDLLPKTAGQVLLLEPRRIAARAAARRISEERGGQLGGEVGYSVRFDQKLTRETRLVAMTEGVLLRRLMDDPFLEGVAAIVFDEFHERGLASDLSLAMARRVRDNVRPDLRLVVMSATLEPGPLVDYLGGCATLDSSGRSFPVDIRYLSPTDLGELLARDRRGGPFPRSASATAHLVTWGIQHLWDATPGDLLCFLPGVGEIRSAAESLVDFAQDHAADIVELYGDLPPEKQDAVLRPRSISTGSRRRIILATNVAETSLTVPGVTGVLDTGLARVLRRDPATSLDRLELSRISKASADQRAGRAGRTQPGVCLRLWTERDHQGLPERDLPEIQRVDLAGSVLQLRAWGESDLTAFPWFEPPTPAALNEANELLHHLGALAEGDVTPLGRTLAACPAHPRIGRLLAAANEFGHSRLLALAGALLSERDPFLRDDREPRRRTASHTSLSDLWDRVHALDDALRTRQYDSDLGSLHRGAVEQIAAAAKQLEQSLPVSQSAATSRLDPETALARALLTAFPDRVARRREPGSPRALLVGGRGVRLAPASAVTQSELFLALDVQAAEPEAEVRLASAIEPAWLAPHLVTTAETVRFDDRTERVEALRTTRYIDLPLSEVRVNPTDTTAVAGCLHAAACTAWDRVFPKDDDLDQFLARVHSLRDWLPDADLPALDQPHLEQIARDLCHDRRSFADLRSAPWLDYIRAALTPAQLQLLDREAPERIAVPSGNRITLRYEPGRPPVLAVRIQELFGLAETPRVARGRIAVLMHLLAPNMRPQQVTQDLKSFWSTTYAEVKKELKRRYPKHAWPDDPWTAPPQSRPTRKPN